MGNCCASSANGPGTKQSLINNSILDENKGKNIMVNNNNEEKPPSPNPNENKILTPNLKVFTFGELKKATRNFRPDTILGDYGFGSVFKGWVDEKTYAPSQFGVGIAIAIAIAIEKVDSPWDLQEWQAEVNLWGKFTHPNLVKLLGYCCEDNKKLLVCEYMQKGSLKNHLFKRYQVQEPLSWATRLKIAIGAARGLVFLHTSEKKVIYKEFKSSNILFDMNYNAKLTVELTELTEEDLPNDNWEMTIAPWSEKKNEYAAPEYFVGGNLNPEIEVYGFGIVLLEMLMGLLAFDLNRPRGETNLVKWAKPYLKEERRVSRIMDSRLGQDYPLKGAWRVAELIQNCVEGNPKMRPSMEEVLDRLEKINTIKKKINSIKKKPKETPKTESIA